MRRVTSVTHEFAEFIPEQLEERTIYVSIPFATAVHRCLCGCGSKVITPISPTGWSVTFNGESISLDPSVGNWNFPCQSHYWIENNRVLWASQWSREEIDAGREKDRRARQAHFDPKCETPTPDLSVPKLRLSLWERLKRLV